MRRVAAPLAAIVLGLSLGACGDDGAEPGAPRGVAGSPPDGSASLVLDFQPNAVHTGVYAAIERGYFEGAGVDLDIREPSSSADAARLLAAGRADFAILDINDLGTARERGLDLVAFAAIVQRPLAAVIAADRSITERPRDLVGGTVGVTGVPSDQAVLRTVLRSDGAGLEDVETVTIGFNAVSALSAMKVEAATGFWNAEGVELKRMRAPVIEFRVDELGAPRYPELVLVAEAAALEETEAAARACATLFGLERGYRAIEIDPEGAFEDLLRPNEALTRGSQAAQLDALLGGDAFSRASREGLTPRLDTVAVAGWVEWAQENGLIGPAEADAERAFDGFATRFAERCDEAR